MSKPMKWVVTEKRWGFVYAASLPSIVGIQLANPGATREEALDVMDSHEALVEVQLSYTLPKGAK